jgi:hypothetical protein
VEKGSKERRRIGNKWGTSTSALNISIYWTKKTIKEKKQNSYEPKTWRLGLK